MGNISCVHEDLINLKVTNSRRQCGNRLGTQSVAEREGGEASAWSGAKVVPLKRALKAQKFLAAAAATGGTTGAVSSDSLRPRLEANWNKCANK